MGEGQGVGIPRGYGAAIFADVYAAAVHKTVIKPFALLAARLLSQDSSHLSASRDVALSHPAS